jgi:RNA polymerase sigma-70 factor, ECF subfamily
MHPEDDAPRPRVDHESTGELLSRIRGGSSDAQERLFARVLPILQRWARGRLPGNARDAVDTDDLVQVTLLRALMRMESFEHRGEGAFLAYLRQVMLNAVRERIRRAGRRPTHVELPDDLLDHAPPMLEQMLGRARMARYEAALARLPDDMRHAVILRHEFEYSHAQIAEALERPSEDAARMLVRRAEERLTELVADDSPGAAPAP